MDAYELTDVWVVFHRGVDWYDPYHTGDPRAKSEITAQDGWRFFTIPIRLATKFCPTLDTTFYEISNLSTYANQHFLTSGFISCWHSIIFDMVFKDISPLYEFSHAQQFPTPKDMHKASLLSPTLSSSIFFLFDRIYHHQDPHALVSVKKCMCDTMNQGYSCVLVFVVVLYYSMLSYNPYSLMDPVWYDCILSFSLFCILIYVWVVTLVPK